MKKILSLLLVMVMVLSLIACGTTNASEATEPAGVPFTVIVTDLDGTKTTFEYTSDAETVGTALLAEGLIAGNESEYGLYVTTVNGITADWDTEKTYWAFYIDGEYAQTGVDATEIVAGTTYELVKTASE